MAKSSEASGGAFYGVGMLGAWVYYVQVADGFGETILALLKGLVWPAFFVYDVLKFIG